MMVTADRIKLMKPIRKVCAALVAVPGYMIDEIGFPLATRFGMAEVERAS